jgi:hypothetical protein
MCIFGQRSQRVIIDFQSMLKLPTHAAFHDLFLNYSTWIISSPAAVALLYQHLETDNIFI